MARLILAGLVVSFASAIRLTPSCGGGESHGHTTQLSGAQIDALVAYLGTL
jgi:hypothetical protein